MRGDDDDSMCCAEITIVSRACRMANGYDDDPREWLFVLHMDRVDGHEFTFGVESAQDAVLFVREMNPGLVHVRAMPEEQGPLLTEFRSHVAGAMAAELSNTPDAPGATLH